LLIKDLLDESIKENDVNLQALIMFLVFEKKVLSMNDGTHELDLYFLPKHNERMGNELTKFKEKMNMGNSASCYRVYTHEEETVYVKSIDNNQAMLFVKSMGLNPVTSCYVSESELMLYNGKHQTIKEIIKSMPVPCYIGSNQTEQQYKWRN